MNDNKSAYNSSIYDDLIVKVLPYYREYHGQIIELIKSMDFKNPDWLDTGCGTGTLAYRALEDMQDVRFTLCDPSPNMLDQAKQKLSGRDVRFVNAASGQLAFDSEFDVVTAVQCHHYLQPEERRHAVGQCYRALRENGVFITFENIKMSTDESDAIMLSKWTRFLKEHDNSEQEIQVQLDRRGVETHPITIEEHIKLLRECGFRSVNLLWTAYLQAGFWALK